MAIYFYKINDEYDCFSNFAHYGFELDAAQTITNTYDEKGRILSQTGSLGTMYMDYEDGSDYHKVFLTDFEGNKSIIETDAQYQKTAYTDPLGNKTMYEYDSAGNLIRETDCQGNVQSYTYNEDNYLTSYTDVQGVVTTMTYDSEGNVLSVSDLKGKTQYQYNEKNLLTYSREPYGKRKYFTYDENGYLISERTEGLGEVTYEYENGRMSKITDIMGNAATMKYDSLGRITEKTDSLGNTTQYQYDDMGRNNQVTDALGNVTRYEHDSMGNVIKTIYPDGSVITKNYDINGCVLTETDVLGNVTRYTRDSNGNILKKEYPDGTYETYEYDTVGNITKSSDILGNVTEYTYDNLYRMTQEQHSDGNSIAYEYYNNGKLKKKTFSDGTWEAYEYDIRGNITKLSTPVGNLLYTYDSEGNLIAETDPSGVSIRYAYDKYQRVVSATDGNGNVTSYAYDAVGNCIGKTNPDGTHVKMTYDALGRLTSVGTVTASYGEVKVSYEYDALGRIVKTTDEMGQTSRNEYDSMGNLISTYDAEGRKTASYTYDAAGKILTETNGNGTVTSYEYDEKTGNLLQLIYDLNSENEKRYSYRYDTAGRMVEAVDAISGKSSCTYDISGNVATVTDPNGGTTSYQYDLLGRITKITNAIGAENSYTYNAEGLLEESKNARNQKTIYEYDKNGRIASMTDEAGTISYFYDNNGNVLSVTEKLSNGETRITQRTYDSMNRVATYTDFRGNTISYGYDELGNLLTLNYAGGRIVRYAYYPNGWMKSVTDVNGNVTSYEYDSKGNITKTINGDGTVENCEYDINNRVTRQETKNATGVVLSCYEYEYDASGNVTKTSGIVHGDIGRVTEAEMTYDKANRLLTYNGEEIRYDADGNMVYGPLDGVMTEFEYDCRNRLIRAGSTTYEYDAENNRIGLETAEYREEYLVNVDTDNGLSQVLEAVRYEKGISRTAGISANNSNDGNDGLKSVSETTTYTYGNGLISQTTEAGGCEYYHYNNIGSTMYLTRDGAVTQNFAYSTYGELTEGSYGDNRFLYNGRFGVITDENGLYYMRARYYNPDIRRFINQDVVLGNITNSQSLNRYAYCQGNPVNSMDPFGLSPLQFLSDLGHGVLEVMGLIPGIGDVADLINATWYMLEGNMAGAFASGISALPLVGSAFGSFMKGGKYIYQASKIVSFGGVAYLSGRGVWESYQNIQTMIASGEYTNGQMAAQIAMMGLSAFTFACAGKGLATDTKTFGKMLQQDGVLAAVGSKAQKIGDGFKSFWNNSKFSLFKSGRETELFLPDEYYQKLDDNIAKAIAARDAEVARIQGLSKTQQSNIATVVAGVDIRTGDVYVGVKNSRVYKGNATCAEDIVFRGLGGNTNANIIMTPAIRPRTGEVIPVCTRCQTKYPQNQFVKGTTFQ